MVVSIHTCKLRLHSKSQGLFLFFYMHNALANSTLLSRGRMVSRSLAVLLCYSRPAVSTAAGWGAEDGECSRGKCSWMERAQPSTASILPEEARALGLYTCSEFDLQLFIQSSVLMSLTRSSPRWEFFSPHCLQHSSIT